MLTVLLMIMTLLIAIYLSVLFIKGMKIYSNWDKEIQKTFFSEKYNCHCLFNDLLKRMRNFINDPEIIAKMPKDVAILSTLLKRYTYSSYFLIGSTIFLVFVY